MATELTENQKNYIEKKVVESKDKEIIDKAIDDAKNGITERPNKGDDVVESITRGLFNIVSLGGYEQTLDKEKEKTEQAQNELYDATQKEYKKHNP